jgi:hypothetical protein
MAGAIINYHLGHIDLAYTGGDATELRLKWGTSPGSEPNTVTFPSGTSATAAPNTVFPTPDQYYLKACAANADGPGPDSAELPADVREGLGLIALVIRS